MSMGKGYHCVSEQKLAQITLDNAAPAPVVTSAGALVSALEVLGAKKIALVAPYMKPLTTLVVEYIKDQGIDVGDYRALEIPNNLDVAAHDPRNLVGIARQLDHQDADVIVLSACVQMPSLQSIEIVENELGKPVVSAAISTAHQMMRALDLPAIAPGAGALLSGKYADAPYIPSLPIAAK